VAFSTTQLVFSAEGCPVEQEVLAEHTPIQGVARYYDSAYHGWTVIDSHLSFADVRHINASDWVYPWHSSVQLVKPLDDGYFVIGGGVLIGPNAILTAAHLGVDETWCYSLEPSSGEAWAAGEFSCHNIAGAAEIHPDGVDAAIVQLISPEDGPFAQVMDSPVASSEAVLSSSWSQLHQNALNDSSVDRLGNENAFCRRWPRGSSFLLETPIFQGGDSGGPLWEGDRLVGLVHGEMCHMGLEKLRWWMEGQPAVHVAVHVPALMPFIAPYLP
jgi:hypothetical protein